MSIVRKAGLAAGAITGAAAVAQSVKLRRFYAQLDFETGEDERIEVATDDGWTIVLHRYRAQGAAKGVPIVAGHGFAGSRLIWDLTPESSLARYLSNAGYDFYALDLRGRGESRPPNGSLADAHWDFDDFVHHDLPAALDAAGAASGSEQAIWLGLEMSGQALYAAAISGTTTRLRAGITLGSPALTPADAQVPGITTQKGLRKGNRLRFRAGAHAAGPMLALTRSKQLESSFRPVNFEPLIPARYLYNGIPDESTELADQFTDWIDNGVMRSSDHSTVWSDRLDEVTLPVLVMAAAHDLQRPAAAVKATFDAIGSSDKTWIEAGVAHGFSIDFGHDDIVAGTRSPAEIFPLIREWIDAHSAPETDESGPTTKKD